MPAADDVEAWRAKFLHYLETNAPDMRKLLTDAQMTVWSGQYEDVWGELVGMYGRAF